MELSVENRAQIDILHQEGQSLRMIASKLNVHTLVSLGRLRGRSLLGHSTRDSVVVGQELQLNTMTVLFTD